MKTKKADFITKVIFVVIAVILTGLIVAFMIGFYRDKRQELNTSTSKLKSTTASVSNINFEAYNGNTISGETLLQLIKEVTKNNVDLSIAVQTLANAKKTVPVTVYYNRALNAENNIDASGTVTVLDQKNKSSDNYITPTANFYCELITNLNDEVTGILFIQKK